MESSFEEFENDLSYEQSRFDIGFLDCLRENRLNLYVYGDNYPSDNKSFSLAYTNTFNNNSNENSINEEITSDKAIENRIEKSVDKIRKCSVFNVTHKIPDICKDNQIIIVIRTSENIPKELKVSMLKKDIECDEYQRIREVLESNPNETRKKNIKKLEAKIKVKKGRKKKHDSTKRNHNTYSPDNLIDKIKNWINYSLITFLNELINSLCSQEEKIQLISELKLSRDKKVQVLKNIIKKINYNFRANRTNKIDNLKLFDLTIYAYLSTKISTKYQNLPENFNEVIMKKLLQNTVNKDIFDFIFNQLTLKDWLEIITYKKNLEDFRKFHSPEENKRALLKRLLKENLFGIDKILAKMYEKDKIKDKDQIIDIKYLNCFTLLIFNLIRYIMIKEGRNKNKK